MEARPRTGSEGRGAKDGERRTASGHPSRRVDSRSPARTGGSIVTDVEASIEALLSEDRVFEPPAPFRANAVVTDPGVYERAAADPDGFWAEQAELLDWSERWHTVSE